ncbi:hypothetical protein JR316_0006210 [Psilocybe cubensis]|uniref:Uncharacterized protein n=2 Tax=Psilocybe cubensis TaxID=181762 RepID=A0ACB8H113_PSICU|nr:hypothetical protein JR316_0006210 [Psilocybe cubensis]KAH9481683.1 hypothetical protein JR316_0006210 [Psilocybe cubensis]
MKNLCHVCQGLDLSKLNNRKPHTYALGQWGEVKERSANCPFCYLVIRSSPGRAVWDAPATVTWKEEGGFFTNNLVEHIAFLNEDTSTSPHGTARQLKPQIDPNLVKKWIKLCETNHRDTCEPKSGIVRTANNPSGLKIFRVIDVIDNCLVNASPGVRFIPLSYVWGNGFKPEVTLVRENVQQMYTKGFFREAGRKVPTTIRDAMTFVAKIGERYLWTDSLCLIQDDPSDLIDGISKMDLVYQCGIFTLVAASGTDANGGLPGVNSNSLVIPRIDDQLKVEVLPGIKMTITKGVYDGFMFTAYRKRGWTMQELLLSHRTVIITKNMTFFCCRKNTWSEDTIYDKYPDVINTLMDPKSGNGVMFLSDNEPNPCVTFGSELGNYATRELTKASDAINAFTGFLNRLKVQSNSDVLQGLLTVHFDIGLLFTDVAALPVPRSATLPKYSRRQGFPTWSWAGWIGGKNTFARQCKVPDDVNRWLKNNTYIVWYVRSPDSPQLRLVWDFSSQSQFGKLDKHLIGYHPTYDNPYGHAPNSELKGLQVEPDESDKKRMNIIYKELKQRHYPLLHFFAHVVFAPRLKAPLPDLPKESRSQVHQVIGTDGERCGSISVDDRDLVDGVSGPYEIILLSKVDQYGTFFYKTEVSTKKEMYWAMLIMWVGSDKVVAERRGLGFVFFDSIQCMVGGRKYWKEIVLA